MDPMILHQPALGQYIDICKDSTKAHQDKHIYKTFTLEQR